MWRRAAKKLDFKGGKFHIDGKETKVWIVGGSGSLYKEGNEEVITGAALRQIILMWIDHARQ